MGRRVVVLECQGGGNMAARLAGMGIFPGAMIEVMQTRRSGPVVLGVQGSRLVLGRGMARRIMVR